MSKHYTISWVIFICLLFYKYSQVTAKIVSNAVAISRIWCLYQQLSSLKQPKEKMKMGGPYPAAWATPYLNCTYSAIGIQMKEKQGMMASGLVIMVHHSKVSSRSCCWTTSSIPLRVHGESKSNKIFSCLPQDKLNCYNQNKATFALMLYILLVNH